MIFVDYVREYHKREGYENLETAINLAINRCIEENVLKDFLSEHRSEVVKVTQLDYTFDRQIALEREEAVRIAQAYKSELERIVISDEDIEHLHNTVSRILEIVKSFQLASAMLKGEDELAKVEKQVASYEQIKALISVDTLKTMQLLGFNYKAAIGEPLTQICADAISNIGNKNKSQQNGNKNKR